MAKQPALAASAYCRTAGNKGFDTIKRFIGFIEVNTIYINYSNLPVKFIKEFEEFKPIDTDFHSQNSLLLPANCLPTPVKPIFNSRFDSCIAGFITGYCFKSGLLLLEELLGSREGLVAFFLFLAAFSSNPSVSSAPQRRLVSVY